MSERLPRLTPGNLTPEQAEVYGAIAGGPRSTGPQLFELKGADGSLNGPFGIMLHQPGIGMALQGVGVAVRYHTSLTDRCREIAILQVGVAEKSEFEWYAHEAIGRAVGLSEDELTALSEGRFTSTDPIEESVARFTDQVLVDVQLTVEDYEKFESSLGAPQMIEIITLVGYYRTLAALMRVFEVGAPGG